jgi:hypothetical protein
MAEKRTRRAKNIANLRHSSGRNLYYLPFSVLADVTVGCSSFEQYINDWTK